MRNSILFVFLGMCCLTQIQAQTASRDSTFHPYHVNYWVTGPLLAVGVTANYLGIPAIMEKKAISQLEIEALDPDIINGFDRWALHQDPALIDDYLAYSNYVLTPTVLLPVALLLDGQIRKDWCDILFMYMETMSITSNIYEWTPIGPSFLNRYRPVTYYDELDYDARRSGNNRNSFYSGHVASAAASTFFIAKVYSDYHPSLGNDKYYLYAAALVPPILLGYFRLLSLRHFPSDILMGIGIGALCGILVPELHRISQENISLGLFTSPEATGFAIQWKP
ncbi:MAG: phosphatase PAP2 family protein [Bacteroidetes bacterium]|nr:phosphatase PAP2 family protein [Bacteroidota bacterium]